MAHRHFIPAAGHDWFLPLYDPLQRLLGARRLFSELMTDAEIGTGLRILDIGCGTGNLAVQIKQQFPEGDVVGIDPDPKALARARGKARQADVVTHFDEGFANQLPYDTATFDRVLSTFMFHHLSTAVKRATLAEARRVLKPGGALILLDFGGSEARADGVMARLLHRSDSLQDNCGGGIAEEMTASGFAGARAVRSRTTLAGRVTTYRGEQAR
jgi:ubiquinone/menaquinone biosynthesis C-methylase UbiE